MTVVVTGLIPVLARRLVFTIFIWLVTVPVAARVITEMIIVRMVSIMSSFPLMLVPTLFLLCS